MKTIFFSSCYPQYLDYFYKKHPALASLPYEEQLAAIMNDHFSVWGSYTTYFRRMGVEADFIIPNCKQLQQTWAKENNVPFEKDWMFNIPIHQVKKLKPEVFFTGSMFEFFGSFLDEIKRLVPHVYGWVACDIPAGVNVGKLELVVTSLPYYVDKFRKQGINSEYMNAAFDQDVLKKLGLHDKEDIDLSFIGSFTRHHSNRKELVKRMLDQTQIVLYGTGMDQLSEKNSFLSKIFKPTTLLKERWKGETWGLDMFKVLKRSKITLNVHIDVSKEYVGNIRMFEATGMGTLLLCDGKNSKDKLFSEDEVAYYDTIDEAIEKAKYYLANEKERREIAERGHQKTISKYNYEVNAKRMHDYFLYHAQKSTLIK